MSSGGKPSQFSGGAPTTEQEARGVRGEEEMLQRLGLDDGYVQLRLLADRRADGCGYDFLCCPVAGGEDLEVEVKTFAPGGGVHVTWRELQRARTTRGNYVLIGLVDDGGPPSAWEATRLDDPYPRLISSVKARLDVDFSVPARLLFRAD